MENAVFVIEPHSSFEIGGFSLINSIDSSSHWLLIARGQGDVGETLGDENCGNVLSNVQHLSPNHKMYKIENNQCRRMKFVSSWHSICSFHADDLIGLKHKLSNQLLVPYLIYNSGHIEYEAAEEPIIEHYCTEIDANIYDSQLVGDDCVLQSTTDDSCPDNLASQPITLEIFKQRADKYQETPPDSLCLPSLFTEGESRLCEEDDPISGNNYFPYANLMDYERFRISATAASEILI